MSFSSLPLNKRHKQLALALTAPAPAGEESCANAHPALAVLCVLLWTGILPSWHQTKDLLSYGTRPLWDKPGGPTQLLPHFWAAGMLEPENIPALCSLHGWKTRGSAAKVEIWDATLFSTEIDLLEIRIAELAPYVDLFIVVESDHTFTGIPRTPHLSILPPSLQPFASKILLAPHPGRPLHSSSEDPFVLEREQRDTVTRVIDERMRDRDASAGEVVVLMGDVDEIPRADTVGLLKACEWERGEVMLDGTGREIGDGLLERSSSAWGILHLQLRQYIYSFEWPTDFASWRLQAHVWQTGRTQYKHGQSGSRVLADSGWHCSFCFRTIPEFAAKMAGFSHADRLGGAPSSRAALRLLDPARIQRVLCSGEDIFGMLREAYRWKDLVQLWKLDASRSAVHLPLHLLQHATKFRFLLPGGCVREERSAPLDAP